MSTEEIIEVLGNNGFVRYAHDYGNSRVNVDGDSDDAINLLDSYVDGDGVSQTDKLIAHFEENSSAIQMEYTDGYTPYYKTDAYKEQRAEDRVICGSMLD